MLAGAALRLLFLYRFPSITADSFIYGDIAKNWLQHGVYGITDSGRIVPTYIRLPGYPAFLALIFSVFGMEHYRAVLAVQLFVDLASCLLMADLARRLVSDRAAKVAYVLAALCPFLANYSAAALTETLEIFFTVLALDLAVVGLTAERRTVPWLGCGAAVAMAILLRPDGGLLMVAIVAYSLFALWRYGAPYALRAALVVIVIAVAPLVPWTLRNSHTMHRFQPLAPRYANEENEFVPTGFNRWVKTWIADYASVEEIYWAVPGDKMDPDKLPLRAFDSEEQEEQTTDLLNEYNDVLHITPDVDARFAALAAERVHHSPLRYYLWLPALRVADMWLRPRTEILPSDTRWWEFDDDPKWSALAVALGVINLLCIAAAMLGLFRGRYRRHLTLLIVFVVLRSAFLATLENPEPRYTLECYVLVILLAAALFETRSQSAS